MNKTFKWTLVGVVGVGLATVLGVRTFMPRVNEDLKDEVVKQPQAPKQNRALNVQAVVLDKVLLADELLRSLRCLLHSNTWIYSGISFKKVCVRVVWSTLQQ